MESFPSRLGFFYWRKYKLNLLEIRRLNNYSKKIKHNLTYGFCIEIFIEFYIGILRELPKKQQHDKRLNIRLMDFCMAIIKKKYYLSSVFYESLYQETIPEEIYVRIKDKEQNLRILSDSEERELFNRDLKRMKRIYDDLVQDFDKSHPEIFYEQIRRLASKCEKISIVPLRRLFYNAHCFMVDFDSVVSIKLYLRYLNVKSSSDTFKYRAILKLHATKLFENEAQKKKFETICVQFRQDNDIEKAFDRVDELFLRVRRKISLHIDSIKEAKTKHDEAVKILGQYRDTDEREKEKSPVVKEPDDMAVYQKALFDLFISRSFHLNRQEVNIFAASRGLFTDSFIEHINDDYYETFDDLLIEEDGDDYLMNEEYYNQLNA
jgi:predicted Zn-dependent protease with MMP-like domain